LGKDAASSESILFNDFDSLSIIGEKSITANKAKVENVKMKVFPNPVASILDVALDHNGVWLTVDVYDVLGKRQASSLRSTKVEDIDIFNWDASSLKTGAYKLVVRSNNGKGSASIIKL
jgi:hypothetical protein